MQWPPLRDFPAVYILVRLSFVEPLSSDFWFVSGADLLPMQQHNATLPKRNPFITANKKRPGKLWKVDKIYRAAFPTAESPALLPPAPATGRSLFPPRSVHSVGGSRRPSGPTTGPVPRESAGRKTQTHDRQSRRDISHSPAAVSRPAISRRVVSWASISSPEISQGHIFEVSCSKRM